MGRSRLVSAGVCLRVVVLATSILRANQALAQSASPVDWTNVVNATPTGSAIAKTSGCAGCSDAGGTSVQSLIGGDGYVAFTPLAGTRLYAGLGSNATASTDPSLIDYAFTFWPDGGWDIRERNSYKTEGRFSSGDVFQVAIVSGSVNYYQNGERVYSSLIAPSYPLVLDTTLIGAGAALTGAVMTAPAPVLETSVAIDTSSLPNGTVALPYAATLQASGGSGAFVWTMAGGSLPPGIGMTSLGALAGTPSAAGDFSVTVRAADAADPTNFAERTFVIQVASGAGAVKVDTTALPTTRLAQPYVATLLASGGSGTFRWGIVAGTLPAGLALDTTSGRIEGTATASGRFRLTVRVADAADATNIADQSLDLSVLAAAPPSAYDAITDRVARTKGSLPSLGPAGSTFADPLFGTWMMRVTDGAVRPGALNRSYRTPSSTHANAWSADGRYFYAVSTDGTVVPFSFDTATRQAARLQASASGDGGLTLRFFNEPTFSYLIPGLAYGTFNGAGSNLRSVDQYDFSTGQYAQLMNLDSLVPNLSGTFTGGLGASAGTVERLFAFFGGTSQDRHFYLVVFDRNNPGNRHLLDTLASTLDGAPANTTLNFRIHAANIDRSGRYITIYPTGADLQAPRSAAPAYVWDIETGVFTPLPLVAAITGGHDAFGYGDRVNQDCCTSSTWDAAQWQYRSLATPLTTFDLITPVLLPKEVYLADHPSWHNAQPDRLVPFIDANYRYGNNTTEWRAWDEEVIGVQTEGAGGGATVWRFAHHRSAVADDVDPSRISFWYTPRVNVSLDGRWALFTSNWEKTLGTDPGAEAGGTHRQDMFLIELARTVTAPPVTVQTSALPEGTVSQPYSALLQASGGSGAYRWSVVAGTLPAGLALDATTGAISGTPAVDGTSAFTVRAVDVLDAANTAERSLAISIAPAPVVVQPVTITTTTMPDAVRGYAYSKTIESSGGTAPLTWSLAAGSLPPGLNLNASTGIVTGTPTRTGNWNFTVRVTDSATPATTSKRALSIRVRRP